MHTKSHLAHSTITFSSWKAIYHLYIAFLLIRVDPIQLNDLQFIMLVLFLRGCIACSRIQKNNLLPKAKTLKIICDSGRFSFLVSNFKHFKQGMQFSRCIQKPQWLLAK